ncbi:MAG: hypothetical protein N2506_07445 [Dehalococcoidales bacterium]|nr:hypothetical protein [Dehalococcoidales bacterium]
MEKNASEIYRLELPARLDMSRVLGLLPARAGAARLEETAREIAAQALATARPRGIYRLAQAAVIDRARVAVDGVELSSRILGKVLHGREEVFPFIVTIGSELDEMSLSSRDIMRQLALDAIKTAILVNAVDHLSGHIKEKYGLPHLAFLNPGELADFPTTQQKPLLQLFEGKEKEIGVSLTSGYALKPIKSRSGIIFPDDSGFLSCRLCTQLQCPGRRAPYDPEAVKYYLE